MGNRRKRLAALNGESRVFVCADCGKVKHVKDAGARVGRTANLVCLGCAVFLRMGVQVVAERTGPFPFKKGHRIESDHYERLFLNPPIWEKDCNAQWRIKK